MEQQKRYGHFDDQHREYVITNPQTPWPWINYLGNEDFFSQKTHHISELFVSLQEIYY